MAAQETPPPPPPGFFKQRVSFLSADVKQLSAMPGSPRHSKLRCCHSGVSVFSSCPWTLAIDASLPRQGGLVSACRAALFSSWNVSGPIRTQASSVTVTEGMVPQKGRHKVCPCFPSVDWVSLCRISTTFPPCSHPPPLWFSARS